MNPTDYKDKKGIIRDKESNKIIYCPSNWYYCNLFQLIKLVWPRKMSHNKRILREFLNAIKELIIWGFGLIINVVLFPLMFMVDLFMLRKQGKRELKKHGNPKG